MEITDDMDVADDFSHTSYVEPLIFTSLVSFFSLTIWSILKTAPAKTLEGRVAVSTSPLPSFFPKKKKNLPESLPPPPPLTLPAPVSNPLPENPPQIEDTRFLLTCTEEQKAIIQNIATVVSTSNNPIALQGLASDKEKIINVHPLCFLYVIFSAPSVAESMKHLPNRITWFINVYEKFLEGVREGLINFRHAITPHIIPFAKALGVDAATVSSCLEQDDGAKALVAYLIQTLPR